MQSIEQKMTELNEISYIQWEEKDEAYLLIYRPYVNNLLVDGWGQTLVIVYVPQLEKVVLVKGYSPVQVSKKQEDVYKRQDLYSMILCPRKIFPISF